jgi:tetratricopeptide (TPR) repeat protein
MKTTRHLLLAAALLAPLTACSSNKPSGEEKQQLVDLHTEMALGYYRMGELERAEGQALKGLELAPKDDMLHLVLAWSLQRKGSTQDVLRAEAIFRKLAKKDDYRAVLGLAQALERKGQAFYDAATQIRSGERETDAPDPEARANELASEGTTTWEESLSRYEETLRLHPDDRDALNGLQRVTALLGRYDESLARSEELIMLTSTESAFWEERLLRPDLSADEEQRFLKLLESGRELQLSSYLQQASVLRELGRHEEELERLTLAHELDPDRPDLIGRRAQVLMGLGRYGEALNDIDAFLKLTPEGYDHPDTRLAYELRLTCHYFIAPPTDATSANAAAHAHRPASRRPRRRADVRAALATRPRRCRADSCSAPRARHLA